MTDALGCAPSTIVELGEGRTVDASYGRGAADWVPVVEWTLQAAAAGAAWDAMKRGARRMRELTDELRDAEVQFLVSRGTAALVAIAHILETSESEVLDVEAVTEPSSLAGAQPSELGYVGVEPWLVSLINADRTTRYVVSVAASGEIDGVMPLPMGPAEALYHPIPPRDESAVYRRLAPPEFAAPVEDETEDDDYFDDDEFSPREEVVLGAQEIADGARSVVQGIVRAVGRRLHRARSRSLRR